MEPTIDIPLDKLEPDPNQPRKAFNEQKLQELAVSIGAHGVEQAIKVRPHPVDYLESDAITLMGRELIALRVVERDFAAMKELLSCVQAEHSLDKAALDSAAEQLAIYAVNTTALIRERDELAVKLQSAERSLSKLREEYRNVLSRLPGDDL